MVEDINRRCTRSEFNIPTPQQVFVGRRGSQFNIPTKRHFFCFGEREESTFPTRRPFFLEKGIRIPNNFLWGEGDPNAQEDFFFLEKGIRIPTNFCGEKGENFFFVEKGI